MREQGDFQEGNSQEKIVLLLVTICAQILLHWGDTCSAVSPPGFPELVPHEGAGSEEAGAGSVVHTP